MKALYILRFVVAVVAASAFVAIWGGWVGLGTLAGFGPVNLLPGIGEGLTVDLAITLPLGVEAFAAIALYVAVSGIVAGGARVFAWCSAAGALMVGAFGQATYHLLTAERQPHAAPMPVVVFVSVLPVAVLGLSSVLLHLAERHSTVPETGSLPEAVPEPMPENEPEPPLPPMPDGTPWDRIPAWTAEDDAYMEHLGMIRHGVATSAAGGGTSGTAPAPPRAAVDTPHRADVIPLPEDDPRRAARDLIHAAHMEGRQITGSEVAAACGMSDRWGRSQLAAYRATTGQTAGTQ
ncbi:hypothetical protein [Salinactinospora qingdaonensis]|uniref:DUF2637 domain-containing protein n=1 Tax=Salinactinospora qingdaonensis TaxID=702744 RepID=A0ABP7FKT7_9ACTN